MAQKEKEMINASKEDLINNYLRENEVHLLERFEKLSNNFKWYILRMIELLIDYQEQYY